MKKTTPETPNPGDLMTPAEVAAAFQVHRDTVRTWGRTGKLKSTKTPGGHRRYYAAQVNALLNGGEGRG